MQKGNFLKKGSGPILESKGMTAIFWTQGKKDQKMLKKGKKRKISEHLGKNVQTWKYFEKGQMIACDYRTQ